MEVENHLLVVDFMVFLLSGPFSTSMSVLVGTCRNVLFINPLHEVIQALVIWVMTTSSFTTVGSQMTEKVLGSVYPPEAGLEEAPRLCAGEMMPSSSPVTFALLQ